MDDDHMNVWHAETYESNEDRAWMRWINELEGLLGHHLDGSLVEDGYALDYAHDLFKLGLTPQRAADRVESNKRKLRRHDAE